MNIVRTKSTKGFYFGAAEAEAENNGGTQGFMHYFEDYLGVLPKIAQGGFIVTGRKGAGKSAVAKYLHEHQIEGTKSFSTIIKVTDVETEKLIQSKALEGIAEPYSVIFEWIVLVHLAKLLVKNTSSVYAPQYSKLQVFLERNRGITSIEKYSVDEISKNEKLEVGIEPLKHAFKALLAKHLNVTLSHAPFYKLVEPLREIVQQMLAYEVNKDCRYTLLFDDLDLFLTPEKKEDALGHLMSLVRVAKAYNTEYLRGAGNASIIVLLREDFKADLMGRYADGAKVFSSYGVVLNWYDPESHRADESLALKRFIDRRIESNFVQRGLPYDLGDPWSTLFSDQIGIGKGGSFKNALDFTFFRPRDLVNMLGVLSSADYQYPLDVPAFLRLTRKYGETVVAELKSELNYVMKPGIVFYVFDKLMPWMVQCIDRDDYLYVDKVAKKVIADGIAYDDEGFNEFLAHLYQYSIIGFKRSGGAFYFNHRESQLPRYFWENGSGIALPQILWQFYHGR